MYLRIGLCEDVQDELTILLQALEDSSFDCQTESYSSGEDFLNSFYAGRYDLILMDIFMKGISGVDTVAKIRATDPEVPIAFLTTSPDFTMEGYRYHVDRYILKPVSQEKLGNVLGLAERNKKSRPSIEISSRGKKQTVFLSDICYTEQSGHSIYIHLTNGEILRASMKISELASKLPSPPFYHCHKSFLVNLIQVLYLDNDLKAFVMNGGGNAYIRRDSLREAKDMYSRFMFEQVGGKEEK